MADQNRNGHLSRFEDFAPVKRSIDDIVNEAIAFKRGDKAVYAEPEPTVVASCETADLVRYRLNSKRLSDAYLAMGDKHSNPYDEHSYADRCARYGVIDRASGEPVAMLWVTNDHNDEGKFKFSLPSFSKTRSIPQGEFLYLLNELDIPPSRRNGDDQAFARQYDLWYEDGGWVAKEPRHIAVFQFESICFYTHPPMKDSVSVYVPLDPSIPLDGGGDDNAAYMAKDHYRYLAQSKFWSMRHEVQPGYSSWMGFGDPTVVKVTGRNLYNECGPDVAPSSVAAHTPQPRSP